jgi:hypothetical protein
MRTIRSRRTLFLAAAGAVGALGLLAGCSGFNDARGIGDAPVGQTHEAPRQVWANVDRFPNVSAFCIGANGVYTTTREAAPVVVPDDPNCAEGGILRD